MTTIAARRLLLSLGVALSTGAIVLGMLLLSFGRLIDGIDSAMNVAILVLLLSTLAGFVLMLIGTIGWAIRAPIQKLAWVGSSLIGLAGVTFWIGDTIRFGFDDIRVLFFQAAFYTPLLLGLILLLSAGIRGWRSRQSEVSL